MGKDHSQIFLPVTDVKTHRKPWMSYMYRPTWMADMAHVLWGKNPGFHVGYSPEN